MHRLFSALALLIAGFAAPLTAQDFTVLLSAGRYEEAAAQLADVNPETAYAGAEMLFEHVYGNAFQKADWELAIRGFSAGTEIPHLNVRQRQRFDFWHGSALVNTVRGDTIQPPALTAEQKLAVLEEAYDLLLGSRDYAAGIDQLSLTWTVGRMIDEVIGQVR